MWGEGGHAWQGGHVWGMGTCMARGACVVEGVRGKRGGMHGRELGGGMRAGKTATEAGGTHLAGMHSCYYKFCLSLTRFSLRIVQ